jgi:hypothetical protein
VLAGNAQHRKQHDEKYQSAHAGAPAVGIALLQVPFAQQRQAKADQQHRPPAHIPVPELVAADGPGLNQQCDDAGEDEHDGPHHGRPPHAAVVGTLRAPLIFGSAALRLPLPAWVRIATWVAGPGGT